MIGLWVAIGCYVGGVILGYLMGLEVASRREVD